VRITSPVSMSRFVWILREREGERGRERERERERSNINFTHNTVSLIMILT
jgi:hypothetical protein